MSAREKGDGRICCWKGPALLAGLLILVFVPACLDYRLPEAVRAPSSLSVMPGKCVLEGAVTLREGDVTRVAYLIPFQSKPVLEVRDFSQCSFVDRPFTREDFQVGDKEATFFTIKNCHRELSKSSWALVVWHAEGTPAADRTAASSSRRDRLIALVRKVGGSVTVDTRQPEGAVTQLDLHRTPVTDADLELLEGLSYLRTLNLFGTSVTDAGLAHLSGLNGLQTLHLNSTAITDAGLNHLRTLKGLKELSLYQTRVTDEGLATLARMTALQNLALGGSGITDRGLKQLKALRDLKDLTLSETSVTPDGVRELKRALPGARVIR